MNDTISTIKTWLGSGSINLFGRPFAGKDTQGEILTEKLGATLIAGGEILRSYHDQDALQQIMATGALIPSDMYEGIILPYLSREEIAGQPLILSSVGRMKGEETSIVRATDNSGHPIKAVILLDMPESEIWHRFDVAQSTEHDRGQRADDNRSVLQNRIDEFNEKTMPVIEFYRDEGLLIEIDGTKSREEVTEEILTRLTERAQTQAGHDSN